MYKILERRLLCQHILQCLAVDAEGLNWDLNNIVHKRMAGPVQRKQTNEAFDANYPDLNASPVLHDLDERNKTAIYEVKLLDRRARAIDGMSGKKLDAIGMAEELLARRGRRREKEPVENLLVVETQERLQFQAFRPNQRFLVILLFRVGGQAKPGPSGSQSPLVRM